MTSSKLTVTDVRDVLGGRNRYSPVGTGVRISHEMGFPEQHIDRIFDQGWKMRVDERGDLIVWPRDE